jgi:hypothetical protein
LMTSTSTPSSSRLAFKVSWMSLSMTIWEDCKMVG